jgi:hypothetical protein
LVVGLSSRTHHEDAKTLRKINCICWARIPMKQAGKLRPAILDQLGRL